MNDLIEFCSCKDRPCPAEFACHCIASIVFLCNICVVDHLREPISHSFIPIDQAIKIIGANSKFNKRNAQIQKNFLLFKDQVSAYLPKLSGFISQIEDFRISILHIFNQECDQNIEFLRKIKADVLSKAELMNFSMAASDFAMVEKFDLTGLGGILASYPEVFELNIEEIKEVIGNMIIIGRQTSSNSLLESKPNTQDLQQKLDFYKAENEEHLKRIKHYKNSENEFTSKIQQLQENLHTYQAENESQARRLINYEKTNEDYTSTIRNLEIKTNRFKTEFEALSKKLLKYEKPEEEYACKIQNLQNKLDIYKSGKSKLRKKLGQYEDNRSKTPKIGSLWPSSLVQQEAKSHSQKLNRSFSHTVLHKSNPTTPRGSHLSTVYEIKYLFFTKCHTKVLYQYDPDTDKLQPHDLTRYIQHDFLRTSCCLLPDGNIIIVGGCKPTRGTTLSFNQISLECTILGDLNIPRAYITLFIYEDYIYAFGGQQNFGVESMNTAERMLINGNKWECLGDMKNPRHDFGCFGNKERIYLIGGEKTNTVEYFDTRDLSFHIVLDIVLPITNNYVWEVEDKIYLFSRGKKLRYSRDFRLLSRSDLSKSLGHFYFSSRISRNYNLFLFSNNSSKIKKVDYLTNEVQTVRDLSK